MCSSLRILCLRLNEVFFVIALPKPVGLFPLDNTFGAKDVINQEQVLVRGVHLTSGPDGEALITFFYKMSEFNKQTIHFRQFFNEQNKTADKDLFEVL